MSRSVKCGDVIIGGGNPVSIQSMTNTATGDVAATAEQIKRLAEAGCQIVRVAVPDTEAALAFGKIKKLSPIPVVADIHFDYRLAVEAIKQGADKVRINPGNLGGRDPLKTVIDAAKNAGIPVRIGVNGGSLEKDILSKYGRTPMGLAQSALANAVLVEDMGFEDIVISVKTSNVAEGFEANRIVRESTDYPIHIGVTEAGPGEDGIIKSSVGIGAMLLSGIGDTVRVSVTGDPVEEIYAAKKILSAAGLRKDGVEIISCPTCGRTRTDLAKAVAEVKEAFSKTDISGITVAVMGCEVNGPGEAAQADVGVAWGKDKGLIFAGGKPIRTVKREDIAAELLKEAKRI